MITRETAKQSIIHDKASEYSHDSFVANIDQVASLIDAVYDSFEQRLCSNCEDEKVCRLLDVIVKYSPQLENTFGCTLFQQCK